jgi:hypothetical protein
MSLVMPELNQKVLSRRDDIIRGLRRALAGIAAARLTRQGH